MADFSKQRARFRQLHEQGCFIIPNPWDVGSALFLQSLGYRAVATSSSGFAFSQGLPDSEDLARRDAVLAHYSALAGALDIPVSADFQAGYAADLDQLAESVRLCIATGVAGFSIEDLTGDPGKPIYEPAEAVERIEVARATIDASGKDVLLTARAESFMAQVEDPLRDAIRRLKAYSEAGADVLFAPCPGTRENLMAIVGAVSPKPVNAIMSAHSGLTVSDLAEIGVRRISTGSALSRAAWTAFVHAARQILEEGTFEAFDRLTSYKEVNEFFASQQYGC